MRYQATVMATEYAGGISWTWNARDLAGALADVSKWVAEEFLAPDTVSLHLAPVISSR